MTHHYEKTPDLLFQIESSPHLPSVIERSYLRAQVKLAEEEVQRLETDLAILLANRSRAIRRIDRCHSSLTPYSKLPVELIEEIVKFSVPISLPLPPAYGKNDPRLRVTQICSSWRKVAFGIPTLWNVYLDKHPPLGTVQLISAWIRQCAQEQIVLEASPILDGPYYLATDELLAQLIMPYSRRIKTLSLLPLHTPDLFSLPWDILTTLSLRFDQYLPNSNESTTIVAPSLRYLGITDIHRSSRLKLLSFLPSLPLGQLIGLNLNGNLSMEHIHEMLALCPSLERCQFNTIVEGPLQTYPDGFAFDLPDLKVLRIRFSTRTLFDMLFLFNVPNLSSFSTNVPQDETEFFARLAKFTETFRHTLYEFEVIQDNFRSYEAPIENIIQTVPSATSFCAEYSLILPDTLRRIGAGEMLPNVEVLRFRAYAIDIQSTEEIVRYLIPKVRGRTSRLKDIHIHTRLPHFKSKYFERLRCWGINVWAEPTTL